MATQIQTLDNDDRARQIARATLDDLRDKYWEAKVAQPPASFDEIYDLRRAYENAAIEYAGLEGRLLRDDILTKDIDLVAIKQVREDMAAAVTTRETLDIAARFIKLLVSLV